MLGKDRRQTLPDAAQLIAGFYAGPVDSLAMVFN
jgi:hypothetical protein